MDVDERAEELASDLGVDKAEVSRDLENLLEYNVPVEEATQSLRRKYGGSGTDAGAEPSPLEIGSITTDDAAVSVTGVVLTVGKRSIRYQDEDRVIFEGEIADASGRISYTAWQDFALEPGATVRIVNANVREWEGEPELNLGERTTVAPSGEALEVSFPVGGESDLIDLVPGDRGRTVEVAVVDVEGKVIDGRSGETEILSGVVGDETGRLPFTDWDPHEAIAAGESLRIGNVYVREFRGVPSVNVSEFSTVEPLDRTVEPATATERSIREAIATEGAFDVVVVGSVVGLRDGSGLIQRCPECGRVAQKGRCRSHGEVEAEDDLRVKAILDDGTGTVTAVLDAELTAELYGGGVEDAREAAQAAMDQSVVAEEIAGRIVGREYRVRGNLSVDEYGANLTVTEFGPAEDDPAERARALLEAVR